MGKILYLECRSGISGDMTVGALLDLGADRVVLARALHSLAVGGYRLHFGRTKKCGLDAYDFDVYTDAADEHRAHGPHDDHAAHAHMHRHLGDINALIDTMESGARVKELAKRMFRIVADAEAKAHGVPADKVHFHEVGAVDSIIDIVGTAVCIDQLGIDEVIVSPLTEGCGTVHTQHGVLPVPVPATLHITQAHGLRLCLSDNAGEMVTPTGAAIAAALRTRDALPPVFRVIKTGLGAGKKDFAQANVLRAMLIEEDAGADDALTEERMWLLESNIDDACGEMLGLAMELLLEGGAADVWHTPITMKKSRPASMLSVLCRAEDVSRMEDLLFTHTTTIGIRKTPVCRTALPRAIRMVQTRLGTAAVKICRHGGRRYCYPEYESVRRICRERGVDYQEAYAVIREEAKAQWND